MDRTRWTSFAVGHLLCILFGGSVAGIVSDVRLQEERALTEKYAAEAALHQEEAHQAYRDAIEERDRALKELTDLKKARKDP